MTHRIPKSILWLRLSGVALLPLALILGTLLLLQSRPVQADAVTPVGGTSPATLNAPNNAPGTPSLTITVEATSATVVPGQTITYQIEFNHQGGATPLLAQLINCLPSATLPHVDGLLVQAMGNVTPTSVQFSHRAICQNNVNDDGAAMSWQGAVAPNSSLNIRYAAQVEPCYDPNPVTIQNGVLVQSQSGGNLTDLATIQVDCLPAVDPGKIEIDFRFWGSETVNEFISQEIGNIFVPGRTYYQIGLNNSDTNPARLGLFGIFPSQNFNIGMPPTLQRVADLGWDANAGARHASNTATQTVFFLSPSFPAGGETINLPIKLVDDVAPEQEFVAQLGYCIIYSGRTCPGADPLSSTPPPSFQWLPPVTFTVRYRDLGDAADSTNHFSGTSMAAYSGVPATFPTVFDPATGPDQGPAHLRPRPFHLGSRVTPEAEADIGPDMDPVNNIIPPANIANRDRRDDGLALSLLSFNHCQSSIVPVRVLIRPAAVAYFQQNDAKGYLNLWLDGNHNGSWADSASCPQNQTAVEHIVIDHKIDVVALGPGLHTIPVPTGLTPWSGQSAWLRATLSEQPSNKTLNAGGINYGDGRGYSTPFQLGETEDRLLRPAGTEGAGPDMAVDLAVTWQTNPTPITARLKPHFTSFDGRFRISYRNEGSETAQDVVLKHRVPPDLRDLVLTITSLPQLGDAAIGQQPGGIDISLGDIGPDLGGEIILSWTGCLTCPRRSNNKAFGVYTGSITVESSNDINTGNDQADAVLELPYLFEAGFASPEGPYTYPGNRFVTCRNNIEVSGYITPNTTVSLFNGGFGSGDIVAQVTSGADGAFSQSINLPNGQHDLLLDSHWIATAIVNNALSWNPSSLFFIDSQGRVVQPEAAGFLGSWRELSLQQGESYHMGLEYCGSNPSPAIQASFLGQVIDLTDGDGDGIYMGDLGMPNLSAGSRDIAATVPLSLSINSGGVDVTVNGDIQTNPAGVVYDSQGGQAVNATVTLLEAINGDASIGFDLWPGADYGQANPQIIGNNGQYAFWPKAGTYRLAVIQSGYQPYRSWDAQTNGESLTPNLPLTPEVTDDANYIIEINADGFEPALLTVPPGSIVKWVNTDIDDHTSTSSPVLSGTGVIGSGAWDSGALGSGESYVLQFSSEGIYTYADQANPSNTAQIEVASGGKTIYLPVVIK